MRDIAALALFVFLVACAAFFGAQFQPGLWYADLRKPPLNPPNWVFGPVWSFLYLTIAVAGWLVWRARSDSLQPLTLWTAQLVLNAGWSFLFFGLRRPSAALLEILVLLVVIVVTTASFFRVRRLSGLLFLPYAAWVSFAAYLNAGIWYLNR
jgi:tryptophan-rich sensory protein